MEIARSDPGAPVSRAQGRLKPVRRHTLLFTFLLAALFVRALVPDGFMPAKGELVELCTMHGPRMVIADPLTGELLQTEDGTTQATCPWSLLLSSLATPSWPPVIAGLSLTLAPTTTPDVHHATRSSIVVPPARAPPGTQLA